ncbi:RGS1-HXK1-INTERACTING PROTEIN 1 [Salix koriyanagi]|uniref:RGS1-HXK1-INTERACTING PROTEIN 1 n=1 Tax=Salix koriyanagi TaxID=2511006 RepID=A0A9Q0U3E9_9ROSI|nr:RGS1-HXK1-INTERACTING PROTEIN 1 [Salix koriyanagi]
MATDVESRLSEEKPSTQRPPSLPPPAEIYLTSILNSKPVTAPWIDNAMQRALIYQKTIQGSLNTAIQVSSSRLSEISSTSQAHFSQTISEFGVYEGKLFGNVKEGINVAASHPLITSADAVGLGLVALKRPRQILYYKTLRLFTSEEALLSQADAKVKELQQSISLLKAESEKLKRRASLAEEELIQGRTKLRQAGKQIQGVICSTYKIERQATGLRDILGELPRAEASRFRSQVSISDSNHIHAFHM